MIISQSLIAKKYATAYLNVYQHELTKNDLDGLLAAYFFFKEHHNFMQLLCTMSSNKTTMSNVFEKLRASFGLPTSFVSLMQLLLKHKRVCCLKDVLQDISCLYKIRNNIIDLKIKTAGDLSPHAVKEFETFFAQMSQQKIESVVQIDRSLIAGVRLQSDFLLWDYSIASRLRALRQKLVI